MTRERAAELLSEVTVLDDQEMEEAHRVAISALRQQEHFREVTKNVCDGMICDENFYVGKCQARKEDGTCISKFPCSHKVEPPKPPTNADRIRAMSDEELAKLLLDGCRGSKCDDQPQNECGSVNCFHCRLEWLQQPAGEEDKHETD